VTSLWGTRLQPGDKFTITKGFGCCPCGTEAIDSTDRSQGELRP
jgi:hypothetical protein